MTIVMRSTQEKIQNELGWKPIYSFEEGIKETIIMVFKSCRIGGKSYNLICNKK